MVDILNDLLIVVCGVVIVVVVLAATFLKLRAAERRVYEVSFKLKAYTELLNAVTEIGLAGTDSYKMDIAKKRLALTVNRLNLVASSGVLKSVNDLLDFFNEHKDKEYDTLRLHNILNTIVIEARRDLNPSHARRVEEARVRYRFFAQIKK
jgi:hypothetical protein